MDASLTLTQAVGLALVQGLTEFLPISSSAHLALMPMLTAWPDQGLAFDCVVHLGTLVAVVVYFRADLINMAGEFVQGLLEWDFSSYPEARLMLYVGLATIPVAVIGFLFKEIVETTLRRIEVIAAASIFFGLILAWADLRGGKTRKEKDWTLAHAIGVGIAQCLALIPGTSRSGITMTAARFLGYDRQAAARFSFLLSIPVIALAGGLEIFEWLRAKETVAGADDLIVGFAVSALSAFFCIHYFLKFIEKTGMMPYVVYRLALGIVLFLWA